jgi:hypothetical protein
MSINGGDTDNTSFQAAQMFDLKRARGTISIRASHDERAPLAVSTVFWHEYSNVEKQVTVMTLAL